MMVHPPSKYHSESNRDIFSTPHCIGNQWLLVPQILQIHGLIACNFVLSSFFRPNDMWQKGWPTPWPRASDTGTTRVWRRHSHVLGGWGNLLTINLCSISIFGKILVTGLYSSYQKLELYKEQFTEFKLAAAHHCPEYPSDYRLPHLPVKHWKPFMPCGMSEHVFECAIAIEVPGSPHWPLSHA